MQQTQKHCFLNCYSFLIIRIPLEMREKSDHESLLDQTRIHFNVQKFAKTIARHALDEQVDPNEGDLAIKKVIQNPGLLDSLNIEKYCKEHGHNELAMRVLIDFIITELRHPYQDPRKWRDAQNQIGNEKLFYMMIDESPQTFKRGIIVTATINLIKEDKVLCRLENGLDGIIFRDDLLGKNTSARLDKELRVGQVLSGRINKIETDKEKGFSVVLKCKKSDLESHKDFLDERMPKDIPEEDLKNANFQIDKRNEAQSKYQHRKIVHTKFLNTSLGGAAEFLGKRD